MSHRDKKDYDVPHPFPNSELMKIKPEEVAEWMALKAFGKEKPGPDDKAIAGRSSSLHFYKKAISYFIPNRLMHWNEQVGWGNPTKSNDLVKATTRKETAGLGKASQARRHFQKEEFEQVIELCHAQNDLDVRLGVSCLLLYAFHMIARLDDSCKLRRRNLVISSRFPFALQSKLEWSKNVREERQCPFQILLGASDPEYCVLLALALHCESSVSLHGGEREFIFNYGKRDPQAANRYVSSSLRNILRSEL